MITIPYIGTKEEREANNKYMRDVRVVGQTYQYSEYGRIPQHSTALPPSAQTNTQTTHSTASQGNTATGQTYQYSERGREPLNQTPASNTQTNVVRIEGGVPEVNYHTSVIDKETSAHMLDPNKAQAQSDMSDRNPANEALSNDVTLIDTEIRYDAVHIEGETEHFEGEINMGSVFGGVNVFGGPSKDENDVINGIGAGAEANAGISGMNMSGSAYLFGRDSEDMNLVAEGELDILKAEATGDAGIVLTGDEVKVGAEGELGAHLISGSVSGTFDTPFLDITATATGEIGAGLKGALMFEDGKLTVYGGAAALVGGGVGVELDFNDLISGVGDLISGFVD